jgi:hypothetical protein
VRLTSVVVMALPPQLVICLVIFSSLNGVCMMVRRGLTGNDFFFFFSFSFFLELRVGHAKKIISALQFIFSFDSIPHLFLQFFVFALIISIWILFLISSLII